MSKICDTTDCRPAKALLSTYAGPEQRLTDVIMFNSRNLGALIVAEEPHVKSWEDGQYNIQNMSIEETMASASSRKARPSPSPRTSRSVLYQVSPSRLTTAVSRARPNRPARNRNTRAVRIPDRRRSGGLTAGWRLSGDSSMGEETQVMTVDSFRQGMGCSFPPGLYPSSRLLPLSAFMIWTRLVFSTLRRAFSPPGARLQRAPAAPVCPHFTHPGNLTTKCRHARPKSRFLTRALTLMGQNPSSV